MRVLITGVAGFVGRRLADCLVRRGEQVSGTWVRECPQLADVDLHEADLLDGDCLRRVVRATAPEAVVHLAALSRVGESWNRLSDYFQVNFLGTENLLTAARDVPVVAMSSAEVYGRVPESDQPIEEAQPLAPRSPYAMSKAAAERLVRRAGGVAVRSFNITGAGQAPSFALPSFAEQLAQIAAGAGEALLRVGDLSPRRDFLHVDDAVEALAVLVRSGAPGGVYNLASGEAVSIHQALDELVRISGVNTAVEVDPARLRPADLPLLCGDASRLRALGWGPRRSLEEALRDLWEQVLATPVASG